MNSMSIGLSKKGRKPFRSRWATLETSIIVAAGCSYPLAQILLNPKKKSTGNLLRKYAEIYKSPWSCTVYYASVELTVLVVFPRRLPSRLLAVGINAWVVHVWVYQGSELALLLNEVASRSFIANLGGNIHTSKFRMSSSVILLDNMCQGFSLYLSIDFN